KSTPVYLGASMGDLKPEGGHPFEVFCQRRLEELSQGVTLRFRNIPHEPKIDEGDAVIGQCQKIAGMGIGLIEAELKDLFKKSAQEALGDPLQIELGEQQAINFV